MINKLIIYNPSISTLNEGDHIIYESVRYQLVEMFPNCKMFELPTQMPVSKRVLDWFDSVDLRFVAGTNLLKNNMYCEWGRRPHFNNIRQWDINLHALEKYSPAILLGCGWQRYQSKSDSSSAVLWRTILSNKYYHSVRDAYTQEKLKQLGVTNTINTGCPTLWRLNRYHCDQIPETKAKNVVTTITDYNQDPVNDQILLDILSRNYETVYIWLQGFNDDLYLESLNLNSNVKIINGGLYDYDRVLDIDSIEFVGTRLHGGIRALQKKKRALFVAIDNRTIEMGNDFGLDYVVRNECEKVEDLINNRRNCRICIPESEINEFKSQFKRLRDIK